MAGGANRQDADALWSAASVLARRAAEVSRVAGRPGPSLPPLLFFTDPDRTPRPWETAARLPAGSGVVFRAFGAADALEQARRLRAATRSRDALLLVGLDADLAEACDADGIHLPERALDQAPALRIRRPEWRLTGAGHDAGSLERCTGLDAVIISPVFQAGGASATRPPLGVEAFARLAAAAPCPAYALGGIDAVNAGRLIGSGACGLAAVSAVQDAFGP